MAQNTSDLLIDQQSRPSETIEERKNTELLIDHQSRPSEKLDFLVTEPIEKIDQPNVSHSRTSVDSFASLNQGQQMEEQGAKDSENYVPDAQLAIKKEETISSQNQKSD